METDIELIAKLRKENEKFKRAILIMSINVGKIENPDIIAELVNLQDEIKEEFKHKRKLAFDFMCNGRLYKPEGCTLEKDFKEKGCGECGKGITYKCKTLNTIKD